MTIREEIIKLLDVPVGEFTEYDKLKQCIYTREGITRAYIDEADAWFKGVIQSLFYKPNKYLLVLEGKEIDKFFIELLWDFSLTIPYRTCESVYNSLVINEEFFKNMLNLPLHDEFIILEDNAKSLIHPGTDKRLASYCTTTEKWRYPQRKNVIVLSVESIDWELYNSIDKLKLWQELFFKFK